jgi:hypothetical protein
MGFLGVWIGSHIVKNMNEFMKFLRKVEQCNAFKGEKKFQFGIVENNTALPKEGARLANLGKNRD